MIDHFYLTLPSNAGARYVTKLPERIRLDDDYEVGLSELVDTWYSVDDRDGKYWIGAFDIAANRLLKMRIKSSYYKSGDDFAYSLTHQSTRTFADVPDVSTKLTFVKRTNRIRMQIRNSNERVVVFSWEFMEFLGFHEKLIAMKEADCIGSKAFDVHRGLNLAYVYCDVASHSIVGDTKSSLLRVCNVTGTHGRVVQITYERPHYVPVGRREFDAIDTATNNELGEPMPFAFGNSVVTLQL
jgi:hypothetical protein